MEVQLPRIPTKKPAAAKVAIMGKSSWLTTTTYGSIEIEYDSYKLYEPFAQMIR